MSGPTRPGPQRRESHWLRTPPGVFNLPGQFGDVLGAVRREVQVEVAAYVPSDVERLSASTFSAQITPPPRDFTTRNPRSARGPRRLFSLRITAWVLPL